MHRPKSWISWSLWFLGADLEIIQDRLQNLTKTTRDRDRGGVRQIMWRVRQIILVPPMGRFQHAVLGSDCRTSSHGVESTRGSCFGVRWADSLYGSSNQAPWWFPQIFLIIAILYRPSGSTHQFNQFFSNAPVFSKTGAGSVKRP